MANNVDIIQSCFGLSWLQWSWFRSLTAAIMMSKDWGPIPHSTACAGVSILSTQGGESPTSTPGVYYQCGHPRLLWVSVSTGGYTSTSSLVNALNRFNIESDCVASVASNSTVEDHMLTEDKDDASFDDETSHTSMVSYISTGNINIKSQQLTASHRCANRKKKLGMKQRLIEHTVAHKHDVYQCCTFPTNELS